MTEDYNHVPLPIVARMVCVSEAEFAKLQTGHDLYEVVRRMNVPQFKHAYVQGLYSTKPFDDFVADMAPFFGLTVRRVA